MSLQKESKLYGIDICCTHDGLNPDKVAGCECTCHSLQKESECCDANKKTSGQWHNENCFYRDITESTERIVILYANLSGRESANRAEFRLEVEKILSKSFSKAISNREKEIAEEVEKRKTIIETHTALPKAYFEGYEQATNDIISILKH